MNTEIKHHNAITTARYEYSESQLNIFFFLLSKLRNDNTEGVYSINIKELSQVTGVKYNATHMRGATETMGSRMFEIKEEGSYKQLWMFDSVEYIDGNINIRLTHSIRPYLFDLKHNFTYYQLYSALRLTSKYAKRIYTLCSQWKANGQTQRYELLELKSMLGLYDKTTREEKIAAISRFRALVLDEAVKQINELTDLRIDYQFKKEGKAFKWIWFTVKSQEDRVKKTAAKELAMSTKEKESIPASISLSSATMLDELISQIESRQDCPLNGSELRIALSALVSWGASPELLNTFAGNYEYLNRAKQYAYSVRMMDNKPVAPLAELIAQLEI